MILGTDDFNRVDSINLGPNWTITAGDHGNVSSNTARSQGAGSVDAMCFFNPVTWPSNQYAQAVVTTACATSGTGGGPAVRISGSAGASSGYVVQANSTQTRLLFRSSAGAKTQLGADAGGVAVNDVLRIEANGTNITVKKNGTTIIGPIVDASTSGGNAGLAFFDPVTTRYNFDSFEGGDFSSGGTSQTIDRLLRSGMYDVSRVN